jgi:hypothetical protein
MEDVDVKSDRQIVRMYRTELLREIRKETRRVAKFVRGAAPRKSGNLRRKIKAKAGWDADGPYGRITTTARRTSTSRGAGDIGQIRSDGRRSGRRTTFRYGLALQQQRHYLQKGLDRTPRR